MEGERRIITYKSGFFKHPIIVGLASLLIPGLGQVLLGQVKKGITLFTLRLILYIPFFTPILFPIVAIPIFFLWVIQQILITIIPFFGPLSTALVAVIAFFFLFAIFPSIIIFISLLIFCFIMQILSAILISMDAFIIAKYGKKNGFIYEGQFFHPMLVTPVKPILKILKVEAFDGVKEQENV